MYLFWTVVFLSTYVCVKKYLQYLSEKNVFFIFWAANVYYLFVLSLYQLMPLIVDDNGVGIVFNDFEGAQYPAAFSIFLCVFGAYVGSWLADRVVRHEPNKTMAHSPSRSSAVLMSSVLLSFFALASLPLGVGASYDEFVEGSGWGATIFYCSVGAYPVIWTSQLNNFKKIVFSLPPLVAGLYFSYITNVRTLFAFAVLGLGVSLVLALRHRFKFLSIRNGLVISLFLIPYLYFTYNRLGEVLIPELHTAGIFWTRIQDNVLTSEIGDSAVLRLLAGLMNYPLSSRVFGWRMDLNDQATYTASAVMGNWVTSVAHFPATWYLDFNYKAWYVGLLESVVCAFMFGLAGKIISSGSSKRLVFLPCMAILQVMFVRGAIWTGSTTVSATVIFLLIWCILVYRIEKNLGFR